MPNLFLTKLLNPILLHVPPQLCPMNSYRQDPNVLRGSGRNAFREEDRPVASDFPPQLCPMNSYRQDPNVSRGSGRNAPPEEDRPVASDFPSQLWSMNSYRQDPNVLRGSGRNASPEEDRPVASDWYLSKCFQHYPASLELLSVLCATSTLETCDILHFRMVVPAASTCNLVSSPQSTPGPSSKVSVPDSITFCVKHLQNLQRGR